jgi:hypothetical protein
MARKRPQEQIAGSYSAIPHSVMDSSAFSGASHPARSLLFELMRQHTGRNNGHMQLATGWLRRRGWKSVDVVQRAKAELITRQLAIKARLGGLNAGPDLWALTWLPISDYSGLTEVSAMTYHPGAWHFLNPPGAIPKRDEHSGRRNSGVPGAGIADSLTAPGDGPNPALSDLPAVPSNGNNEVTNAIPNVVARRVVGKSPRKINNTRSASPH